MGWGCASPTSPQHRAQPFPTNSSGAIPRAGAPLEILCWLVRGLSPCCLSPPLLLGAAWCRSIPGVPEVPGLSSSCLPCHFPQLQPLFLAPAEAASRQPGRREGAGKHAWYFPPKKTLPRLFSAQGLRFVRLLTPAHLSSKHLWLCQRAPQNAQQPGHGSELGGTPGSCGVGVPVGPPSRSLRLPINPPASSGSLPLPILLASRAVLEAAAGI